MTASNRSDLINSTFRVLKKHYTPVAPPVDRPVLEHLLYGCCLENNTFEKADSAFARIKQMSFDWNEVRVTSISELAELMSGFFEPKRTAASFRQLLQSVFDANYSFDLEHWRKQNLGKTIKELEKHQGATQFVVSYVTQHALAGHAIALDRGALDAMQILGVISDKERARDAVPGLERAIPKKHGVEFSSLLHHLAADLIASPYGTTVRGVLLEINPECKDRLPKRPTKKRAPTETDAGADSPSEEPVKPRAEESRRREKNPKKPAAPAKPPAKKVAEKSPAKKTSPVKKPATKPPAKQPPGKPGRTTVGKRATDASAKRPPDKKPKKTAGAAAKSTSKQLSKKKPK